MSASCGFKWEGMDQFKPPDSCNKYVSNSKYLKQFGSARARTRNNALLSLHWKKEKSCHHLKYEWVNELKLGSAISESLYSEAEEERKIASWQSLKPSSSGQQSRAFSDRFLNSSTLFVRFFRYILGVTRFCDVDLICLALTCKTLMTLVLALDEIPCSDVWGYNSISIVESGMIFDFYAYMTLMRRLERWMPASLKFCHHCMRYRAPNNFISSDYYLSPRSLICWDCARLDPYKHSQTQRALLQEGLVGDSWYFCRGCYVLKEAFKIFGAEDRKNILQTLECEHLRTGLKVLWRDTDEGDHHQRQLGFPLSTEEEPAWTLKDRYEEVEENFKDKKEDQEIPKDWEIDMKPQPPYLAMVINHELD